MNTQLSFHEFVDPDALGFDPEMGGEIGWSFLTDDAHQMMVGAIVHIHEYKHPIEPSKYAYRAQLAPEGSISPIELVPAPDLAGSECQTWIYEPCHPRIPYVGISGYEPHQLARFTAGFVQRKARVSFHMKTNGISDQEQKIPDFLMGLVTCKRDVYIHTSNTCFKLENPEDELIAWMEVTPPAQITWSAEYPRFGLGNTVPGALERLEGILESEVFAD